MNNQFDERLVNRISEVFDNYEDNFADEGWKELRKKFPVKQRRNPLMYWIGSAAAVLILAIGLWVVPSLQEEEAPIAKVSVPKKNPQPAEETPGETGPGSPSNKNVPTSTSESSEALKRNSRLAYVSPPATERNEPATTAQAFTNAPTAELQEDASEPQVLAQAVTADPSPNSSLVANQAANAVSAPSSLAKGTEPVARKRSLLDIAFEEEKTVKEAGPSEKKVTFGVYAGSFVSYAEGSENKVNLGAGFSSDIALSKRLKLSTGIAISQNNLSFDGSNDIPMMAQANFQSAFVADNDRTTLIQPASYSLEKYDASLLGVDIPVNLKYTLAENKRNMFISAGFSSGAFINESYTYHYSSISSAAGSSPSGSEASIVKNEDKMQKDFGNFDIARMLNLSFGVGYQMGKQQKLVIEPFVKYPLKGIGAENLRFGAGGVNLKLNFETNRK